VDQIYCAVRSAWPSQKRQTVFITNEEIECNFTWSQGFINRRQCNSYEFIASK
jgi:hypothetical protein